MDEEEWKLGKEGLVYSYAQITFHLAFRHFNLVGNERIEPEGLGFPRAFTWNEEIDNEIEGLQIQSVLTTAFFFEAYINDYGARYLEKSVASRLDKLDTPSKFLIITKLVWKTGLDNGSHDFEKLQKLFRLRNSLAHPKPANKGNLFDTPSILLNGKLPQPPDNAALVLDVLRLFSKSYEDDVTEVLLKQMGAWIQVAVSDTDFYPIRNNAGL